MSKIIMILRKGGKPNEVKVVGVPGATCKSLSAPFEKILGGKQTMTPTADMNKPAHVDLGTGTQQIGM